ncbi:MAG: glycosyltransferase family 4 protein [Planctomycetota bacterium]|nr:glycosyltransferase family 4 protein [Planctomycetota bacterium]
MRILHVEKFYPPFGGVGRYIQSLSVRQRRRGHEVLNFGCVKSGAAGGMPRYHDFTARRSLLNFARMVHNSEAAGALAALLRRRSVDVAHLHNIYHHLTPSILPVLADRRIGIVMTVHDYRLLCPAKYFLDADGLCMRCQPNRFYHAAGRRCAGWAGLALAAESYIQRFRRRYLRWVDLFLCPTRTMRRLLVEAGVPAGKAVVAANPVEPPLLPPGETQRRRELLFVGRLERIKAPDLMLTLAERIADADVVIAGDGDESPRLAAEVQRRSLRNVTLTGKLDAAALGRYFARASAVVVPSRCMENSPAAMLEAMACGRCVIVPDSPPLRQWVRDGQTGRLFAPDDVDSLETVVRQVLDRPARRDEMAQAARKLIRRRHDADLIVEQMEHYYVEASRRCELR